MKTHWIGLGWMAAAALACGDDAPSDDAKGGDSADAGTTNPGGDRDGGPNGGDGDGDGDITDVDGGVSDAGPGGEPSDGCPANIDPATVDFGITKTDSWTLLGGPQQVNGLPGGARADWGLLTVTRCGIFVLGENDQRYDAYVSSGAGPFTKISTAPTEEFYKGGAGVQGPLRVVDDMVVFRATTNDNTTHLMTIPLTGGAFEKVTSPDDDTIQIFGFAPAGDTSYILSQYGAGVFSGLLSVPTAKLLDSSFVVADTTSVRSFKNEANGYLHPYGADKLLVNNTVVDPSCTGACSDSGLPPFLLIQGAPFATDDGVIVNTNYDKQIVVVSPEHPAGVASPTIGGLRGLNDVAMANGVGVASYDVDNVNADKVVLFRVDGDSVTIQEPPAGLGNQVRGVWTNGKIALVYNPGGTSAVYGIRLQAP